MSGVPTACGERLTLAIWLQGEEGQLNPDRIVVPAHLQTCTSLFVPVGMQIKCVVSSVSLSVADLPSGERDEMRRANCDGFEISARKRILTTRVALLAHWATAMGRVGGESSLH